MIRKLKKNDGETLMETMIALLIAVISVGLVATATITAAKMNKNNREADEQFRQELEMVENYSAEKEVKQMLITFEECAHVTVDIDVYGKDSLFASYKDRGTQP